MLLFSQVAAAAAAAAASTAAAATVAAVAAAAAAACDPSLSVVLAGSPAVQVRMTSSIVALAQSAWCQDKAPQAVLLHCGLVVAAIYLLPWLQGYCWVSRG